VILLLASVSAILTAQPLPLDMPRAEPYLVRDGERSYMEDRYCKLDLWVSRAVDGRWVDEEGRVFTYSTLREFPPFESSWYDTISREAYVRSAGTVDDDDITTRRRAAEMIAPCDLASECDEERFGAHGFSSVEYWQGTNETFIACTFLPKRSKVWRIATWHLAEDDDISEKLKEFEEMLFTRDGSIYEKMSALPAPKKKVEGERALLREDARHSVAAYPMWRVTEAPEFTVLDEIPQEGAFIVSLTNELSQMRKSYAEVLPTPLDGSGVLCVARLFSSRERYHDALEVGGKTNMLWSAAYWSSRRREIVAYLPFLGASELLRTFRHEAFHQYITYACSAIAVSPWLNEGYAQYFEAGPGGTPPEQIKDVLEYEDYLPTLLYAGYDEFYSGSDAQREVKYRLALSVACFIERGAPQVRFKPFKNLKRDYIESLLDKKDMHLATAKAFQSKENLELFISEWRKFWQRPD
jgi:hypothetical protein